MYVCVCVHARACVRTRARVSTDKILRFINTLIIITPHRLSRLFSSKRSPSKSRGAETVRDARFLCQKLKCSGRRLAAIF